MMRMATGIALAMVMSAPIAARADDGTGTNAAPSSDASYRRDQSRFHVGGDGSTVGMEFLAASPSASALPRLRPAMEKGNEMPGAEAKSSAFEFYSREQTGLGTLRTYVRIKRFHWIGPED